MRVRADGDEVRLEVADDGPGLSDADAQRIFERFFRADPSRSRAHGGAGVGLAIVEAIVRAHGGAVTVGKAPSGRTRFTVRLRHCPMYPAGTGGEGGAGTVGVGTRTVGEATARAAVRRVGQWPFPVHIGRTAGALGPAS